MFKAVCVILLFVIGVGSLGTFILNHHIENIENMRKYYEDEGDRDIQNATCEGLLYIYYDKENEYLSITEILAKKHYDVECVIASPLRADP